VVSIAAISGNTSGGGAELGWACDIRIAEEQARFAQPEVEMGLTTGIGGCSRLARLAGRATATDMVLTGDPVSARRLYDLGAISRLVPGGRALDSALQLAESLSGKSPAAVAGLKRILTDATDLPLAEALKHEQSVFQSVVATGEAIAGMQRVQSGYDEKSR
jgi:enoyl-CoA hydratase/carnithine racemase